MKTLALIVLFGLIACACVIPVSHLIARDQDTGYGDVLTEVLGTAVVEGLSYSYPDASSLHTVSITNYYGLKNGHPNAQVSFLANFSNQIDEQAAGDEEPRTLRQERRLGGQGTLLPFYHNRRRVTWRRARFVNHDYVLTISLDGLKEHMDYDFRAYTLLTANRVDNGDRDEWEAHEYLEITHKRD